MIQYTDKQKEAWKLLSAEARAKHVMLFGGSRSGKTFTLVAAITARAWKYPASRHAIIRYRYNAVKQSVGMDTLPKVLAAQGIPCEHNRSEGIFFLPNGSEIWLVGLDDSARVEKILGKEFATVYFNECSEIDYNSCQVALTRLAQNVTGLAPKAFYDCNPAGKSHWSYKVFIQRLNPLTKVPLANPENYASLLMNPTDNRAHLPTGYIEDTLANLSDRQRQRFLEGKWLDDMEGALWRQSVIDAARVVNAPELVRIVIGIDPAVTSEEGSDATGIVAAGVGVDGEYYVLADATLVAPPVEWARAAVELYWKLEADKVLGEANNGGDLIEALLRQVDPDVAYRKVWASRGKIVRAEPVAAIYEKGKVHHVGTFPELEEEMCSYAPLYSTRSPNRMDALVWALTELAKHASSAVTV